MNRKLFILTIFFFGILFTSSAITVNAGEMYLTPTATNTQDVTVAPEIIKYDLAFPGMLPDHPLYKLKVLRDKITASAILDPEKKINFYLLQTDKGILATAMLVDKNKIDLAGETALKAENNFTLLASNLHLFARKPGPDFFKHLETAGLKHQEVLRSLVKRVPKDKQKVPEDVIGFSKRNLETIEIYRTQE